MIASRAQPGDALNRYRRFPVGAEKTRAQSDDQRTPRGILETDREGCDISCARLVYAGLSEFGPNAPTTLKALLGFLHAAWVRGYAMIDEVFAPRMSAVAAPVVSGSRCVGVISLAGPRARLTVETIHENSVLLRGAANELAQLSNMAGSPVRPPLGKG